MTLNLALTSRHAHVAQWVLFGGVLALAALMRFWSLASPNSLVFDEWYYVRDAISQLQHGFPTGWPDFDAHEFSHFSQSYTDTASLISHPPLGKWLIGAGTVIFGADNALGWRAAVAFSGTLTVAATMVLALRISKSVLIASTAGLLLAIDGVHVVLSRVSLLDGFLTLFVVLGALFAWEDLRSTAQRFAHTTPILWLRPWLWGAAICFGCATAVKWSGLFALLGFAIFLTIIDVSRRVRSHQPRLLLASLAQAAAAAVTAVPIVIATYLATWVGWITVPNSPANTAGTPWWQTLWDWHTNGFGWHTTLTAEHPYQSAPLTWPLALRPTAMYVEHSNTADGCDWAQCTTAITPLPNVLVTWGGVLALVLMFWVLARAGFVLLRRHSPHHAAGWSTALAHPQIFVICGFVLTGYLSGWLPWVLLPSRSAVFHFYSVVMTPFAALALALVIGALTTARTTTPISPLIQAAGWSLDPHADARGSRRMAVAIFLTAALIVSTLFFPVWSGSTVPDWFWQSHLWLPGWA